MQLGRRIWHQLETEDTDVEVERAFQISDLQVDVADADTGIDWRGFFYRRETGHGWE